MSLFENPGKIEFVPWEWDWAVRDALVHAKGEGLEMPEPHLRFWAFRNGLRVGARLSRVMLLAKVVAWDVWVFLERPDLLTEAELARLGLSRGLLAQEMIGQEEVEEYLELAASSDPRF